ALIVADVDNEALAREHWRILLDPLIDVAGAHGPKMDIADFASRSLFYGLAASVFPFPVAQIKLLLHRDPLPDHVSRFSPRLWVTFQQSLLHSLIAQDLALTRA